MDLDKFSNQNPITITFQIKFAIPGLPYSGILRIAYDDLLINVKINSQNAGCTFMDGIYDVEKKCNVTNYLVPGINTILFIVQNTGGPGGLIYLLNVSVKI